MIELHGTDTTDAYQHKLESIGYKGFKVMADEPTASIPDDDGVFDFVVCKDVLEHVLLPEHSIREIQRVLKPAVMLYFMFQTTFHFMGD